jgi:hypothetical protein
MVNHVRILGVLHLALGGLGLLAALCLLLIFGGVTGIIGWAAGSDPEAMVAIPIIGIIACVVIFLVLILSVPCLIAGYGLLQFRPWARILTIILSVLNLFHVPFGTALGIYGIWVLLSLEGQALFGAAGPTAARV